MKELLKNVDKHRELIFNCERYIWSNAETGYKEFKTSKYLKEIFIKLGYELIEAEGITGFYTVIDTGRKGPNILILGEMDSVICPTHPQADKETGAVHACGHNAQCAALVGIAAALKEKDALKGLCGKITLCAVPAEELLELEYRNELKKQGKIKHLGGKAEFLSRGYFDEVDIAFMVHASDSFHLMRGNVGCMLKNITYKGKAAHAGSCPHLGRNALYAANCGINAVNALRETFREEDIIRVHPIITNGGAMVNAIPQEVTLESYVRGKSFEAIANANRSVDRALCGAALSLGTNIEIDDQAGYAPLVNDENMYDTISNAAALAIPEEDFKFIDSYSSGSTDMGDLCAVMPVIHPYSAGAQGDPHGSNYYITDPEKACVKSAKLQLAILYLLLERDGELAKEIISNYKPQFASIKEYLAFLDSLNTSAERIEYGENGVATVKYE